MRDVVLISAVRTPTGKFQGALAEFAAPRLGALVVREAVRRAHLEQPLAEEARLAEATECIMGCVVQAGLGQNPARQAALFGGLSIATSALTVNQVCGSGLRAAALGVQSIAAGDMEVVIAGGMESMTNAPYLAPGARAGLRMGHATLTDSMIYDGLWDAYNDFHMGTAAEVVAETLGITRLEQDTYAAESHARAAEATGQGVFRDEVLPVELASRRGEPQRLLTIDEPIRPETTVETLARLKPAFKEGGTVTAGNSPGVSDGAAAVALVSAERAAAMGLKPLAVIRAQAVSGRDPVWFSLAPVEAVRRVAARAGWALADVDLFELNEAFAVQALAVNRTLELDPARVNVHGGAVALGHPIGASGARVLVTLVHALHRYGKRKGIAALCLGGGNAVALAVERF